MGCGGSSDARSSDEASHSTVNGYDRRPKISVRIQNDVKKLDTPPRMIFIFGGPGSRKGPIVDDLVNSYGFKVISTEEIILHELPKKVSNTVKIETMKDIKEMLEEDSSTVTMEWILQQIERRIETEAGNPNITFLIDYLPNLKCLLKIPTLIKDCSEPLAKFEEKYKVSFALNLAIPADKMLKNKQTYCAKPNKGAGMKDTGGQGDEADLSRLERRASLYEETVKSFLTYFAKSERLVTVDVTCGVADLIWHQVHEVLCDLEFQPQRTVNTVILFAFDDDDLDDIDTEKYVMQSVSLKDIVLDPKDSVENLLSELCTYMDKASRDADAFVVTLSGTSITKSSVAQLSKNPIIFLEVEEIYLEHYLPGSPKNFIPKKGTRRYKAISSLENELFLFSTSTPLEVCRKVAAYMTSKRIIK